VVTYAHMKTRKVCPECDRTDIYKRRPSHPDIPTPDETWYCGRCGADFDDPNTREPNHPAGYSGLTKDLIEADPEDLTSS